MFTALWHHALYITITVYLIGVAILAFQRQGTSWKHLLKWPKFFFDIDRYEKFMAQGSPASWQQADDARKEIQKIWNPSYGPILIEQNADGGYYVVIRVTGKPSEGLMQATKILPSEAKGVAVVLKPV